MARDVFREDAHPRDSKGKFIETGAEVRLRGGADGVVVGVGKRGGWIVVDRTDGQRVEVHRGNLTVVRRADGSAPTTVAADVRDNPVAADLNSPAAVDPFDKADLTSLSDADLDSRETATAAARRAQRDDVTARRALDAESVRIRSERLRRLPVLDPAVDDATYVGSPFYDNSIEGLVVKVEPYKALDGNGKPVIVRSWYNNGSLVTAEGQMVKKDGTPFERTSALNVAAPPNVRAALLAARDTPAAPAAGGPLDALRASDPNLADRLGDAASGKRRIALTDEQARAVVANVDPESVRVFRDGDTLVAEQGEPGFRHADLGTGEPDGPGQPEPGPTFEQGDLFALFDEATPDVGRPRPAEAEHAVVDAAEAPAGDSPTPKPERGSETVEAAPRVFDVRASDLDKMIGNIDTANRRAERAGIDQRFGYSVERYQQRVTEDRQGNMLAFPYLEERARVTLDRPEVKHDGWTFVATLSWDEEAGLVTRVVPDATLSKRPEARVCDVCHSKRDRKDTYVVQHDDGSEKQVGSNCLTQFLGIKPADVWMLDWSPKEEDDDGPRGGGRSEDARFDTVEVLALATVLAKRYGWVSRSQANVDQTKVATAERMDYFMSGRMSDSKDPADRAAAAEIVDALPGAAEDAVAARDYARTLDGDSEYVINLRAVASADTVSGRNLALLASAVASKARQDERNARERATADSSTSQHVGVVGGKIADVEARVVGVRTIDGDYGTSTLISFVTPDGNVLKWFASGNKTDEVAIGDEVSLSGGIKGHGEFRGVPETSLTRVKVRPAGDEGAKQKAAEEAEKVRLKAERAAAAKAAKVSVPDGYTAWPDDPDAFPKLGTVVRVRLPKPKGAHADYIVNSAVPDERTGKMLVTPTDYEYGSYMLDPSEIASYREGDTYRGKGGIMSGSAALEAQRRETAERQAAAEAANLKRRRDRQDTIAGQQVGVSSLNIGDVIVVDGEPRRFQRYDPYTGRMTLKPMETVRGDYGTDVTPIEAVTNVPRDATYLGAPVSEIKTLEGGMAGQSIDDLHEINPDADLLDDQDGDYDGPLPDVDPEIKAGGGFVPFKKGESAVREKAGNGAAKVKRGDYVEWSSSGGKARGKVDLVVTGGQVPGIKGDNPIFASKASPAARVIVYEKSGNGWKPTSTKVGHKATSLTKIAPLSPPKPETKGLDGVVEMLGMRDTWVTPEVAEVAYERGLKGWPGEDVTILDADGWARGRVKALLDAADGEVIDGFADADLLDA